MDPEGWRAATTSIKSRCEPSAAASSRFRLGGVGAPSLIASELDEYATELQSLFDKEGVGALSALDYWNSVPGRGKKPLMRKVWKYVGAMQATQTASERVFSYLRLIMGDRRWALSDGLVEDLVAGTASMMEEVPLLSSSSSEEDVQRFEDLYSEDLVTAEDEDE